jgi:hypothetical protein
MRYLIITLMLICGTCYATWVHCPVCDCDYKQGEDEFQHGKNKWCDRYSDYEKGYKKGLKDGTNPNYKDNKLLWKEGANLNEILNAHEELRLPVIPGEQNYLAMSEFCPYCGAFSYYHRLKGDERTCCRCYVKWTRTGGGNYYANKAI